MSRTSGLLWSVLAVLGVLAWVVVLVILLSGCTSAKGLPGIRPDESKQDCHCEVTVNGGIP